MGRYTAFLVSPMSGSGTHNLQSALAALDSANSRDPRLVVFRNRSGPRELIFSELVDQWVQRLDPFASETLRLAARGHTLERWHVPRSDFPMDRIGYRAWREACAQHHAKVARRILTEQGYDVATIQRVVDLTLKSSGAGDSEAQTLEDADCLAFLEMKLADYVDEWEPAKAARILRKTLNKMSPTAREIAKSLNLDSRARDLLNQAMA